MNTSVATAFENPASWYPRFGLPASLVAAIMGLATCGIQAQTTQASPLQIRQTDGKIFLDYYPGFASTGATMLHFSPDPGNLQSTNASIFDIPAASSGPITWDVTTYCTGPLGFFNVSEYPGAAAADFVPKDDVGELPELIPDYALETLSGFSYPLQTETDLPVHFRLLDGATRQLIDINGSVRLALRDIDGVEVSFAYTLTPSILPMTGGNVNSTVRITTGGSLSRIWLDVVEILPAASGPAKRNPTAKTLANNGTISLIGRRLSEFQNADPAWINPLSNTVPISGSFGEWREKEIKDKDGNVIGLNPAGRPHEGMDLVAPNGTEVRPVKRGVVSKVGDLGGNMRRYVIVDHGDGTASEYLHVKELVKPDDVVEVTTVIAKVADSFAPGVKGDHLHLEIRVGVPIPLEQGSYVHGVSRDEQPGVKIDPGMENGNFSPPLMVPGNKDTNPLEIKAAWVWGKQPKSEGSIFAACAPTSPPFQLDSGETCKVLVAQAVDSEGGYLVPAFVEFWVENPVLDEAVQTIRFEHRTMKDGSATDVRRLFQNDSSSFPDFGYVRRAGGQLPREGMFQYWFRWDTGVYETSRHGPRTVIIRVEDRAGNSAQKELQFGPEITAPGPWQADPTAADGTTFNLAVTSFMGPFPQVTETDRVKPVDEITLTFELPDGIPSWNAEFVDADGNPLPKPVKLSPTSAAYTAGKASLTARVRIRKKADSTPGTTETLTLRAVSKVFPGIAHDMEVQVSPFNEFAVIPAGEFVMGDQSSPLVGYSDELPVHTVHGSAFYLGKYEVTKEEWDAVRAWGLANGYADMASGNGSYASKGANHPVHSINWYDIVKWCNARSQKEGLTPCFTVSGAIYKTGQSFPVCNWSANGYRLPTEAEWEKAARGGLSGKNFPWGDTISHSQANYYSSTSYAYDVSPTRGYHPTYAVDSTPDSSPSGSFASNGYGLYDMAGNMWEWCWDWYGSYAVGSETDPRGASSGSGRVYRGGGWDADAGNCRVGARGGEYGAPTRTDYRIGFRLARSSITQSQSGLVAYYPFEGNADDASGHAHDGITNGVVNFVQGKVGQAASFYQSWIQIPNVLNDLESFSISMWVYEQGMVHSGPGSSDIGAAEHGQAYIWFGDGRAGWAGIASWGGDWAGVGGGNVAIEAGVNPLGMYPERVDQINLTSEWRNRWHHLSMTYDNQHGRRTLFVDGVLVNEKAATKTSYMGSGAIGSDTWEFGAYRSYRLVGLIDEVRIYDHSLSSTEIQQLYNLESPH